MMSISSTLHLEQNGSGSTSASEFFNPRNRLDTYSPYKAQTHARNAVEETKRSNPVAASEEHDLAAAEFATAAQGSSDHEAVRILNLLEQHHKKLGHILKARHEKPVVEVRDDRPDEVDENIQLETRPTIKKTKETGTDVTVQPPRLKKGRPELSSSIASNLATARGIPPSRQKRPAPVSPLISNQHADGRNSTSQPPSTSGPNITRSQSRPSWTPPLQSAVEAPASTEAVSSDSPFQLFYNTFETAIAKLSAPLAFASLPLVSAPSTRTDVTPAKAQTKLSKAPKPITLDYSQLISREALRAVNSNNPGTYNPTESFYVVPTTGGTTSYADIISRAEREESRLLRHHRQRSNLSNISEDDFADAKSTILPQSPALGTGKRNGLETDERKVDGKTMEELALENETLRHLSDTLSRRLHVFEMSSQTATNALAQSIRSMGSPHLTPEHSRSKTKSTGLFAVSGDNEGMTRRVQELEDILKKSDAKLRKKDEEAAKLRDTLAKYREKWDSLKAGAKARREVQRDQHQPKSKDADQVGAVT